MHAYMQHVSIQTRPRPELSVYREREGGGEGRERQVHMYVALVMMLHKDPHAFRIGSEARVEEVVRDFHV